MKKILSIFVILSLIILAQSCKRDTNTLVVGVMSGPELELAKIAKEVAKKQYNLDVDIKTFDDYITPNEALVSKDIDINAFQHKPFLDDQSSKRGYKLVIVGNTFIYPLAAYSDKIKKGVSIDDSFKAMVSKYNIATIPNDPTNQGRALLLLQKEGIIKLKDGSGVLPKLTDISENKYNIEFKEMDAPLLPSSIKEKNVLFAICNNNYISQIGLNAVDDGVFLEDKDSPYVNLIVSREDNKDDEKVKTFVKAYQSDEVNQAAIKTFKNSALKGW